MFDCPGDLAVPTPGPDPVRRDCTRRTTGKGREAAMHRIGRAGLGMAVLTLLVLVGVLAIHDRPAAASERSPESAAALHPPDAKAVLSAPYLSAGVALIRSRDTRFVDGEDTGHAALYGNEELFDAGAVGNGLQLQLAERAESRSYRLRKAEEFACNRSH